MKRIIKRAILVIAVLLVCCLIGFFVWTQQTYEPTKELLKSVGNIEHEDDWVTFKPSGTNKEVGVILYPGAKVEPKAYGYLGKRLSDAGYTVGIPKFNLNLAMLEVNKAEEWINRNPSIKKWFIGGHSLGGVSAATFAHKNPKLIKGVILLASYPASGDNFSNKGTPILSIYAEKDGLTTRDKIEETKNLLSSDTVLFEIKGGNHAQFGMYGEQKGDNQADISAKEQQDLIADEMIKWLDKQ
ncbi:carboxymethylenebutenolidase [Fictibacillus phosphorivorans]|uniref:Carboxymethylenebutenolidase n=1 Tax=Fictibacillus phosphorivorans TaxID=1221500 RepID=A0A160IQ53_9BACL|nr:alpha/beta hydrolase [Fictibacillus phosphorivorans]ANC78514.1 carboxymethylenebutenolidase [Fictibacillus phosphorivorans]